MFLRRWLPWPSSQLGYGCFSANNHSSRLLKNAHLRRCPHPSSLRRTSKYASLLRISGALHLDIFEQSEKNDFFTKLLVLQSEQVPFQFLFNVFLRSF